VNNNLSTTQASDVLRAGIRAFDESVSIAEFATSYILSIDLTSFGAEFDAWGSGDGQ
jgi:hypothetical protein